MALTRKLLKSLNLTDEQVDAIIEAHGETVEALKAERDNYKTDAEKVKSLQEENEKLKGADDYEKKYNAEHEAFEKYKKAEETGKIHNAKKAAYRKIIENTKIDPKRIDTVLLVADRTGKVDAIELDENSNVKDKDKYLEEINKEWSDLIPETRRQGEGAENPPAGGGTNTEPKSLVEALRQKYTE